MIWLIVIFAVLYVIPAALVEVVKMEYRRQNPRRRRRRR